MFGFLRLNFAAVAGNCFQLNKLWWTQTDKLVIALKAELNRGAAAVDIMRKAMCFYNTKAYKHFLSDTWNKNMNLKISVIRELQASLDDCVFVNLIRQSTV